MKLKVGDTVLVTTGKDKGKTGQVVSVLPSVEKVVVKDVNLYTRHIKPYSGRAGEQVRKERPLHTGKVAILNEKNEPDRLGIKILKSGEKVRIFKKTGTEVPTQTQEKVSKK